jgi:PAS domain S-box-containing protein
MIAQDRVNILLVDDQPAKLVSYEAILAELGENLVKANSAREALHFLLKNDVAVVLVDVCMPELDGFELARMLREHPRYEKTAIIFISAIQISELDYLRGYETGAVDYVPVPVVPDILRAKVKVFAELWRKTRQLEMLNGDLERRVEERTSEVKASAAKLREVAERLHLASEAAGFGTYDYNAAAGQVYWSPYLRQMVGIEGDAPLTIDDVLATIHPDHRKMVRQHIDDYVPEPGRRELEFKIVRPDGEERWLLDRGQVVADAHDPGIRLMGTVLDITDRKREEERGRLLMAELDHRVKNILGNVSAIARLSSRRAQSVGAFVDALDGRIQAISRAHGLLRRSAWIGANLADLASESLSPFQVSSNIEIIGEPLSIIPELAQSMSLIFHELATNAVKHGSLSDPKGRVRVSWSRPSDRELRFAWEEYDGPATQAPAAKGFGLTVLQTAAQDLGATANLDFRQQGFVYTLTGPFQQAYPAAIAAAPLNRSAAPSYAAPADANGRRILVVEDEALVALQLQSDLESAGYRVVGPARSLERGLELAVEEGIDAALLDVSLGRNTSAPIAEALIARKIPLAFVTGYSDRTMLPAGLRSVPTLNKPYVADEIRALLGRLLSHRSSEIRTPSSVEIQQA